MIILNQPTQVHPHPEYLWSVRERWTEDQFHAEHRGDTLEKRDDLVTAVGELLFGERWAADNARSESKNGKWRHTQAWKDVETAVLTIGRQEWELEAHASMEGRGDSGVDDRYKEIPRSTIGYVRDSGFPSCLRTPILSCRGIIVHRDIVRIFPVMFSAGVFVYSTWHIDCS